MEVKLCLVHLWLNVISGIMAWGIDSVEDDKRAGRPTQKWRIFWRAFQKPRSPELLPVMAAANAEVCEC
ncbi:hypothetical protein TNCV_1596711 [Trichonephila clavipes]|nr:hypothetical protein TNCV_1596711 [Trichonephila clavipes]